MQNRIATFILFSSLSIASNSQAAEDFTQRKAEIAQTFAEKVEASTPESLRTPKQKLAYFLSTLSRLSIAEFAHLQTAKTAGWNEEQTPRYTTVWGSTPIRRASSFIRLNTWQFVFNPAQNAALNIIDNRAVHNTLSIREFENSYWEAMNSLNTDAFHKIEIGYRSALEELPEDLEDNPFQSKEAWIEFRNSSFFESLDLRNEIIPWEFFNRLAGV